MLLLRDMNDTKIYRPSIGYYLLYYYSYLYYHIFYRRVTITGRENIPKNTPVIFAANHQNALMDALAMLYARKGKVVFLARADIFKSKFIARLLHFLKIMPVYRMRDGFEALGQNEETFDNAANVLKHNTPIAMLPEGNHAGFKRLRPLKKGICRIAFMAEEHSQFKLNLHIVPVGLDYSNYFNAGERLLINFGKPIRIADYIPLYHENPQRAISRLRDDIAKSLKPLMINIENEELYNTSAGIIELYYHEILTDRRLRNIHRNRFAVQQEISARLNNIVIADPEALNSISPVLAEYRSLLEKYNIRDWLVRKNNTSIPRLAAGLLLMLVLLPIHIYGMLFNYLPYHLPVMISRKVKDRVFHSSIHFGMSLFLYLIYYLILITVFCLLVDGLWLKIAFALSLPLTGIFAFYNYRNLLKIIGKIRFIRLSNHDKSTFSKILSLRQNIIAQINTLFNRS
jgi:1-acyl-sn-glycerol-3-phosphate acyltransferase